MDVFHGYQFEDFVKARQYIPRSLLLRLLEKNIITAQGHKSLCEMGLALWF